MLAYVASAVTRRPDVEERVRDLVHLLIPHARSERTLLSIALHSSLCFDFAVPHILLSKLGYRDGAVDDFLKECAGSLGRHRERPPFGAAEQKWVEGLWSAADPDRRWHAGLRNSVLNHPVDILGGLREDAYALTHLLMYCTDFGYRAGRLPRPRSVILSEASSLLAKCLDAEDYDLAGELVLAWPLMGAPWGAAAAFGFRVLAGVEDHAGVLPGGTTNIERMNNLSDKARTDYVYGTAYHTAYVMGMICAASLREGRAPPKRIAGSASDARFVQRLLPFIARDQGHWQSELDKLENSERHTLATFVLDIAIAQKCRKHDYEAVRQLLVLAHEHGQARSPLCAQAAQLLGRLTAYTHAKQVPATPN